MRSSQHAFLGHTFLACLTTTRIFFEQSIRCPFQEVVGLLI